MKKDIFEERLKLVDDSFASTSKIEEECRYLKSLSKSLKDTGQDKLSLYISEAADIIIIANNELKKIRSRELELRVEEAEASAASTIATCLGIKKKD